MLKTDQKIRTVKAYNNGVPDPMFPLGITTNNGLAGLLWWEMDSKIRGRSLYPITLNADVMRKSFVSFADYLGNKDNTSFLKLPSYKKSCDFEKFYLRFQASLANQMRVRYTVLGFIMPYMGATYDPYNDAQKL